MKIKLELNAGALSRLQQAVERAALGTVEATRGEVISAQVMPFDTGDMQNNQTKAWIESTDATRTVAMLGTDVPQARRLYHHPEYAFQVGKNPDAQGEWLRHWLPGGNQEKFVPETFEKLLKGELA